MSTIISTVWHPVVQDECAKLNLAVSQREPGDADKALLRKLLTGLVDHGQLTINLGTPESAAFLRLTA